MHVLFFVISTLAGAAFWYYRLQAMGNAGREVIDYAQKVRGERRRKKLKRMTEESPVAAINCPVVAAATLMMAVAKGHDRADAQTAAQVRELLSGVADDKTIAEAATYAEWAHNQIRNPSVTLRHVCPQLLSWLTADELENLRQMLSRLPHAENDKHRLDALNRLS